MSRKDRFKRLYDEFGAPIVDKILQALGDGAGETAVRKALRQQGYIPLSQNPLAARLRDTSAPPTRVQPAKEAFDPRIEKRVRERPKVESMEIELAARDTPEPESLSVFDLEGRPFITSMSDMAAARDAVTAVDDVTLAEPVSRMGGQDYMFDQPNSVWAADLKNAADHLDLARQLRLETGQDPVFLPWAMGPTAIDFSHMPRELMLRYAEANMPKATRGRLERGIREIVPEFETTSDPASFAVFQRAVGKQRGALNSLLDQFREQGGLGIGSARLAMTDLDQIGLPLTSLRNVGVISSRSDLEPSRHPSYRTSVPGEGVGRLREPIGALDLLPDILRDAELSDPFGFPVGVVKGVKSPLRSLQMAPKGGVITEDILRVIGDRLDALDEGG